MDENKLNKLREMGFHIRESCMTCKNSGIGRGKIFGVCKKFEYDHLKHNENPRNVSITILGKCDYHERDETKIYEHFDIFSEKLEEE